MDQLKFEFGGGALQRYKHLPYKIEYALAEFIDNSIHSFEANAESLMKKFSREHCAVDIFWDSDKHELEIYDNAGGIHEDDFRGWSVLERLKNLQTYSRVCTEWG